MALARATPQQSAALDVTTHAQWGGGAPVAEHVARERRLRAGWWPRATHSGWVWTGAGEVLASCETYEVSVGGRWPGRAWAVASVFVAPEHRGHGYASALLRALAADRAAEPGARAMVLFSDLERHDLYARLGYVARPAVDRVGAAEPGDPDDGPWLRFGETELAQHLPPPPPDAFQLHPTLAQLDWHLDQARLRTGPARGARCGARAGDDTIVWVDHRPSDALLVLAATTGPDAPTLWTAAARTAAELGLREVRAWETPAMTVGTPVPRVGGAPMLLPLDPAVDPAGWNHVPRGVWV